MAVDLEFQRRFGRRLRARRVELELSQDELADHLGVHRTFIGGLERGERNVTLRTVERVAARLDIDPLKLLAPELDAGESEAAGRPRVVLQA